MSWSRTKHCLHAAKNLVNNAATRRWLSSNSFKVRRLHQKESATLAISQTSEGSRLTASDLKQLHSVDPEGFFVAIDDAGDIIGTIGAARWSDSLGFIGFCYAGEIAKESGVEESLWTAALEHLGDRNVGIEVSTAEADKCSQLGFQEAWTNGCYKGKMV